MALPSRNRHALQAGIPSSVERSMSDAAVDREAGKRIRVLEVCTILLTARVFVAPVAKYLSRRGYEVAVVCSTGNVADGPLIHGHAAVEGFPVYHVDRPRTIRPIRDLLATWSLYRLFRMQKQPLCIRRRRKPESSAVLRPAWQRSPSSSIPRMPFRFTPISRLQCERRTS